MNTIKIFYNGFKLNGEKELIKAHFSFNSNGSVSFYGCNYKDLPRGFGFNVTNDSDHMTDYFGDDHAVVNSDHPLYKYIVYSCKKSVYLDAKRELKKYDSRRYHYNSKEALEAKVAEFEALEVLGQPTAEECEAACEYERKQIEAAKAERERKEAAEREQYEFEAMVEEAETEITIKEETEKFPYVEGEVKVVIGFSERRGIQNNSVWSLKAADNIFRILDAREHEKKRGYDKTDFEIIYNDENGEESHYEGRYDIGDGENGLIDHIMSFAEYERTHKFGQTIQNPPEETELTKTCKYIASLIA